MLDLPLHFDRPGWLVLLVLLVPAYLLSRRSIGGQSRAKSYATFGLRAVVIVMLSTALARPVWEKRGEGLCVTLILDRSQSIPPELKNKSLDFLRRASEVDKRSEDRLAVITAGRDAMIVAMPDRYSALGELAEPPDLDATNLEAAVNLALAIMPQDTANRIVLATDGNETEGSVMAAAELAAANDVPVDVLVLKYDYGHEVIFERITAPTRGRLGQSANIKMVLRSQARASGRLSLSMNDQFLDLNGDQEGNALRLTLPPGLTVIPVTISLDTAGPLQFSAVFEADDSTQDEITRNNEAVAVTFVGAEGKILVIDDGGAESAFLVGGLEGSELSVEVMETAALARGPVFLAGYDAVVLANIPRWAITDDEDRALHAYVHDLGGGLIMLGGAQSFGAGGWIDSEVERVLPVKLDPPQTRQMPRGALALIMHSTEMPQGNFWGQKIAIAAIEALSRLDFVGIIDYGIGGVAWEYGPQLAGDKSGAIAAAKKMVMGDMPDFAASMQLALDGLAPLPAGQKHVIIISDGDPAPPPPTLLNDYAAAKVTVSTVLIAGHGSGIDRRWMENIARSTNGRFYGPIINPKSLPQIFIKEAQLVSRSLIVEGDRYFPQVVSRLPGPVEGFTEVPPLDGYVLTAPREGLSQIPIVSPTTEGNDPILANWNYGLGKSVAFTSSLTGVWGSAWVSWPQFGAFWEQVVRWVMRPSAPANVIINTMQEGDQAVVDIEALKADASSLNFLNTSAVVLTPDGETMPLRLQQTGPGRYRGEFRTSREGAYLVNVNFTGGSAESPIKGNVQAAVSVPYPPEFRSVTHNEALLRQLAERTGGRVLSDADPMLVSLFDRGTLPVPKSPRAVWDLLAILAAALFVLDVAARRIAVDRKAVAASLGRMVGRRADVGTETVAAWKRVARRRSETAEASTRYEAEESAPTLDVEQEVAGAPRRPPDATQRQEPPRPVEAGEQAEDEGDYTQRLLAAKRRAREQRGKPDEDGGDG